MIGSLCYVGALPFHDSLAWPGALKKLGFRYPSMDPLLVLARYHSVVPLCRVALKQFPLAWRFRAVLLGFLLQVLEAHEARPPAPVVDAVHCLLAADLAPY